MKYFLLAILAGYVLRFLAKVGLIRVSSKSSTDSQAKLTTGFHICMIAYMLGSLLKYGGYLLLLAFLVKELLLT